VATSLEGSECACSPEPARRDPLYNPPERPSLSYRLGTYHSFLSQMLERLPWQPLPDGPYAGTRPLASLATHSDRDPTVALLDAFSVVADVLTFYQERIVNEGFLRTATESRSVTELTGALGHVLSPGLAASTWLALTVEDVPGAPEQVVIEPGMRALSIPGQDELPQPFETSERVVARREWNQLLPVTAVPQELKLGAPGLWLQGLHVNLAPGDSILIVGQARESQADSTQWELRTLASVTPDPSSGRTRLTFVPLEGSPSGTGPIPGGGKIYAMRHRAAIFGYNAPDWLLMPPHVHYFYTKAHGASEENTWPKFKVSLSDGYLDLDTLYPHILPGTWTLLAMPGKVALCWVEKTKTASCANFTLAARCSSLKLRPFPNAPESTSTTLPTEITSSFTARRQLIVLGQGEELPLADRPFVEERWGAGILAPFPNIRFPQAPADLDEEDAVSLDRVVSGLPEGRPLIIQGKRLRARIMAEVGITLTASNGVSAAYARGDVLFVVTRPVKLPEVGGLTAWRWHLMDAKGFEGTASVLGSALGLEPAMKDDPMVSEVVMLESGSKIQGRTKLRFAEPLRYWYDRATVTLSGNVAAATHGETVREVLGSGDGSRPNQRFTLKRAPVTWVPAATPSGRRSTLEVRVEGVLWHEVASFHGQGPRSRAYLVHRDEQGRTTIVFGDGTHGARLPTGQENVVATYRIGIGWDGAVTADKIAIFQSRPLGLRAVTNPMAATGAEPPDRGEMARRDAPTSVLTLDRIVSVMDCETFAQSFAGIGKARAAVLQRGEAPRLHVTLALADGAPVPEDAAILDYLKAAMDAVRDTTIALELAGFEPVWFRVAATVHTAPGYRFEDAAAAARRALFEAFAFKQRAFGQDVSAAEIIALLQGIPGIEFVDLDGLDSIDDPSAGEIPDTVEALLIAKEARWGPGGQIQPAQLLLLDPSPLGLTLRKHDEEQP
jgi:hypothetical protein